MSSSFDPASAAIAGGSLLGGIASGIIGAAANSHAAKKQFQYQWMLNKQASDLNYFNTKKLTQWNAENSPTFTRKGLESAGYNPMLAVTNGMSGAVNASMGSGGSAPNPDYLGGMSAGISNAFDFKRLQNESEQTASNIKLNEANTRGAIADAISKEIHNQYLDSREKSEIGKIGAETSKLNVESDYLNASIENMEKRLELDKFLGQLDYKGRIDSANIGKEGVVFNASTLKDIAEKHSPSGRSASFGNYTAGVRNLLQGVGGLLHGSDVNYENYDESTLRSYKDNGQYYTTTSRRSGKRRKKK